MPVGSSEEVKAEVVQWMAFEDVSYLVNGEADLTLGSSLEA